MAGPGLWPLRWAVGKAKLLRLLDLNHISNNIISVGQRLFLPPEGAQVTPLTQQLETPPRPEEATNPG